MIVQVGTESSTWNSVCVIGIMTSVLAPYGEIGGPAKRAGGLNLHILPTYLHALATSDLYNTRPLFSCLSANYCARKYCSRIRFLR